MHTHTQLLYLPSTCLYRAFILLSSLLFVLLFLSRYPNDDSISPINKLINERYTIGTCPGIQYRFGKVGAVDGHMVHVAQRIATNEYICIHADKISYPYPLTMVTEYIPCLQKCQILCCHGNTVILSVEPSHLALLIDHHPFSLYHVLLARTCLHCLLSNSR